MEKAHNDLINILLQVLDSGQLTDSNGKVAKFTHCIIIMTSNAGAAESAKGSLGIHSNTRSAQSLEFIKKAFRPEFLNRLDSIVEFNELDEKLLINVVEKFINELQIQLAEKKVKLLWDSKVLKWLFKKGYDPAYGARPFARMVDQYVKTPLVDELLFGSLVKGGQVVVSVKKEKLHFEYKK